MSTEEVFINMVNNHAKTLVNITPEPERQVNYKLLEAAKPYQWKPGQSGNPLGRPKDVKYISEAIRELIKSDPELLREIVLNLAKKAKTGDVPAFKELTDRVEGKVADKIEGTENPITIILRPAKEM